MGDVADVYVEESRLTSKGRDGEGATSFSRREKGICPVVLPRSSTCVRYVLAWRATRFGIVNLWTHGGDPTTDHTRRPHA